MKMTSDAVAFPSAPGGGGANFATLIAHKELITCVGIYASMSQINPTAIP